MRTHAGVIAAAWTPEALSGLVGLYDDQSGRWQDTGGTTAATSGGHAVKRWDDRSGNGLHLTASANNPSLAVTSGEPSLSFVTGSNHRLQASWSPGTLGDWSLHCLLKLTGTSFGSMASLNSSGVSTLFTAPWTTGMPGLGNTTFNRSPWLDWGASYHLISWTRSGTVLSMYLDGILVDTYTHSATLTPNQISLGLSAFSSISASILAFAVCTAANTADDVCGLASYYRDRFDTLWARPSTGTIWMGNSLGTALYADLRNDIATKVHVGGLAPSSTMWWNASVGGKTTQQMLADHVTRTTPFGAIPTTRCVHVIWECTNDIVVNGVTGAQAAMNLWTLCDSIRAQRPNDKIVVATVIDRNQGGWSTPKAACNGAILANYAAHADAVADLTGISTVSADGANANPTYFSDGVHLTSVGNDQIKAAFGAAIEAAIAA